MKTSLPVLTPAELPRPPVEERFRSHHHPLTSVTMLVTEQCNLRCDYCYIYKMARRMTPDVIERSVDFLFAHAEPDAERLSICLFGGEPLLVPKLVRHTCDYALARAAECGVHMGFSMTSNATLLDDERLSLLLDYRISSTFSLDGIGPAHDRHRRTRSGKGSFGMIEANLQRLLQVPGARIRLTVTPETAGAMLDSVRWLLDRGFSSISLSPVIEAEWDAESLAAYHKAWTDVYRLQAELLAGGEQYPRIGNIRKSQARLDSPARRGYGCGAARNMVAIDARGNLYPCHRFVGYFRTAEAQRIGDVFTGFDDSKREYYIASNHTDSQQGCGHGLFRRELPQVERACSTCSLSKLCGSSCMAVNEYVTGDPRRAPAINRLLAQVHTSVHVHEARFAGPEPNCSNY